MKSVRLYLIITFFHSISGLTHFIFKPNQNIIARKGNCHYYPSIYPALLPTSSGSNWVSDRELLPPKSILIAYLLTHTALSRDYRIFGIPLHLGETKKILKDLFSNFSCQMMGPYYLQV